ncbi:GspE/PulE family protein [Patescibacteria group bacterium]|nr:GspE/PulE family protein [Patescibacteria group bacterium]
MITKNQTKLLEFLQKREIIREPQAQEMKELLNTVEEKNIRQVLVNGGFVDAEKLAEMESEFWSIPYVNLLKEQIDEAALITLPLNLAEQHFSICFAKDGKNLKIALSDPDDYNARESIDFWAAGKGFDVSYYLCSVPGWQQAIRKYQAFGEEVKTVLTEVEKEKELEEIEAGPVSTEKIEEVIRSAPVSKIVAMIVKHAIESRASDIHIEPYGKAGRVRFRIDGVLQTVLTLPAYIYDSVISRIKVLSDLKIDETRIPQDGRFKYEAPGIHFDLRVSIMPLSGREKATLRLLDTSGKTLTLEQLGFSLVIREIIDEALKQTFGMILVTGPTGSGKSTTLSSLLSKMNKEGVNIATLEDPIEYNLSGVNQSQIRPDVKFTFASGLRALMRQDPDIIMVGEIRDSETAEMAVHAALTGHLLFSTLHTNDSVGSIPRLIDMKVEPFLLSSTINLIIAQRLSRRICSKCKESYEIPADTAEKIRNELLKVPAKSLPEGIDLHADKFLGYRGKGCPACKETGYSGRVVIAEALPITEKMRVIIAEGMKHAEMKEELEQIGMVTLLQDGLLKVLQGITTLEEVFRVSKEVEEE